MAWGLSEWGRGWGPQDGSGENSPPGWVGPGGWEEGFPEVVSGLALKHGQDFTKKEDGKMPFQASQLDRGVEGCVGLKVSCRGQLGRRPSGAKHGQHRKGLACEAGRRQEPVFRSLPGTRCGVCAS